MHQAGSGPAWILWPGVGWREGLKGELASRVLQRTQGSEGWLFYLEARKRCRVAREEREKGKEGGRGRDTAGRS